MAHWVSEFHRFEEPKVTTTTTAKTQYQDVTDHTLIEVYSKIENTCIEIEKLKLKIQ